MTHGSRAVRAAKSRRSRPRAFRRPRPSSNAVKIRAAAQSTNQRRRHRHRAQRLNRHAHRLHAHAFIQPEHHGEKKRDDEALRERRFKSAGEERARRPAGHSREQPWKTIAKRAPGRCVAHFREMKAERFEEIVAHRLFFRSFGLQNASSGKHPNQPRRRFAVPRPPRERRATCRAQKIRTPPEQSRSRESRSLVGP